MKGVYRRYARNLLFLKVGDGFEFNENNNGANHIAVRSEIAFERKENGVLFCFGRFP